MSDDKPVSRGRRIHVEGADASWNQTPPPVAPGLTPAAPPHGQPARTPQSQPARDLRATASRETLERNRETARASIGMLASRVARLRARVDELATNELAAAAERIGRVRADTAAVGDRRTGEVVERQRREAEALVAGLRLAVNKLAGDSAVGWSELREATGHSGLSRYLRVGAVDAAGGVLPALVPFLGHHGLFVAGDRRQVDDLIVAAVARTVAQAPLKKLRIVVFDPRARGVLGRFAPLRQVSGATFPTPTSDTGTFGDRLVEVLATVSRDAEVVAATAAGDLVDLWRSAPVPEGTLQVVVLLDYPAAVDEALQTQLLRLAATESPVRPALLIGYDATISPAQGVDPDALRSSLVCLEGAAGGWVVPGYPPQLTVRADAAPTDAELADVVGAAVDAARSDTGPTIPLRELIGADMAAPWQGDSTDALDLAFGRSGNGLLQLSLRTENPPYPNMLVGGAVGTGKSNLLLDIIYGLATRYSPEEFELHLLDFKQGLEFARFAPDEHGAGWLPHVRTLGLESDRAFGVALLEWFLEELERRSERFKEAGQSSIVGYRNATGHKVPRLLLIVDEFHELFGGSETERERAVEAVELLARQGRVYGVHLLLASQTTSGVSALAVKGESIFAQFPLRLSLKNSTTESEAILAQGNKAAADLTYRGEVVFNTNVGRASRDGDNQIGIAAYAEPTEMAALQRQLWNRGHGDPPLVFLGKEYAAWPTVAPATPRSGLEVWLGRPITVDDNPRVHVVAEDADQALVVLGQAKGKGAGPRDSLRTMILTALPGLVGGEVVVLDGDGEEADGWFDDLARHVTTAGVGLRRLGIQDAAAWIRRDLKARLEDRSATAPLLVVGLAVQRLRDLDVEDPLEDEDVSFEDRNARVVLQDLAKRGAQARVFFFGNWNTLRTMETDLGAYGSGVAAYVTVDLGLEDLRSIAGPMAQRLEGSPRVGYFDRAAGDRLEVLIPYRRDGKPEEAPA